VLAAVLAGAAASLLWPSVGSQLWGLSLLGLVGWLAASDVARHTVRGRGLPRVRHRRAAGRLRLARPGRTGVGRWRRGHRRPAEHPAP